MTKKQTNLPEQLHSWYLEAVKELKPESFNPNANKPYSEITDEQKSIDIYIANKITNLFSQEKEKWIREIKNSSLNNDQVNEVLDLLQK